MILKSNSSLSGDRKNKRIKIVDEIEDSIMKIDSRKGRRKDESRQMRNEGEEEE